VCKNARHLVTPKGFLLDQVQDETGGDLDNSSSLENGRGNDGLR